MEEQEATERQVHLFGEDQVFPGLRQRNDLGVGRSRPGHLVAGQGVAVHGVDASLAAHHFGQGNRHVSTPGADVGATPARAQAEAFERRGQWPSIDVVAEACEFTHDRRPSWASVPS
jgi:hypothetical protein